MPATEIYLIRHGQTDYNRQFRLQGRSDIPLNRLGLAQARAAHEALRGVHFDAVYASPLRRAVDTACIVSGWPEEKIELDPRLIEIGFGIWEGSDFRTLGPAGTAFFETPQNYTPPQGGESLDSVLRRTGGFLAGGSARPCRQPWRCTERALPADQRTSSLPVLDASFRQLQHCPPGPLRRQAVGSGGISGAGRPRLSPEGTARREHAGRGNCTKARAMMPLCKENLFFLI